jgi:hypothetical protein
MTHAHYLRPYGNDVPRLSAGTSVLSESLESENVDLI